MYIDSLLQFTASGVGDLPTAQTTTPSTNIIDLHMAGIPVLALNQGARDIGIGDDPALKLLVQVKTAFTSGGAATLQVALQGAADDGTGAPTTWYTWWTSPAYALATVAVAGARLLDMDMPRPPAGISIPRFIRLAWIIGTTTMTGGALQAFLVLDRHDQPYSSTGNAVLGGYPAGITVAN